MPFKRPSPTRDSSQSSSNTGPRLKRARSRSPSHDQASSSSHITVITVYIVQAKLDPEIISDLFRVAEGDQVFEDGHRNGVRFNLCHDVGEAEVVVTAVHMRRRLERHIDWGIAKDRAIVTPQWLLDSARQGKPLPCGDYVALHDLQDETEHNCPDTDCHCRSGSESHSPPPNELSSLSESALPKSSKSAQPRDSVAAAEYDVSKLSLSHTARYSCCRASPLICPNQGLVAELDVIRRSRSLEGEERSALSYQRAIAVIKAFPKPITSENLHGEVSKLPYLGQKLMSMIEEYVEDGQITESVTNRDSSRFQALSAFTTIYGIGPHTARKLHAEGMRTIRDLEYRFGETETSAGSELISGDGHAEDEEKIVERSIQVSLTFGTILRRSKHSNTRIPRDEVEEMNTVVMRELDALLTGCTSTIVGGYRRGKPQSNDVDIVITHMDAKSGAAKIKGLCKKFVRRLYERGLVTHVMHLSSFRAPNALRTTQWDSLEKALTVFILPPSPDGGQPRRRIHRRLDLIFAAPEVYWTAIVGWTGSTMFERDLRLWAKEKKGLKFDSAGITRRHDSKAFFPKNEQEVFKLLGLDWVPPPLRNADA